jgi:hypothetical protein
MHDLAAYIRDRLAEPGTMRSLAVVLFALTGAGNSQAMWEAMIYLGIVALGMYSAGKPESTPTRITRNEP